MDGHIEISFVSQHGENQSPAISGAERQAQRGRRDRHIEVLHGFRAMQAAGQELGLVATVKESSTTMSMDEGFGRMPGPRMMGGGPIVTDVATLTLITAAVPVAMAFIKAAKDIIVQMLANDAAQSIKYTAHGKTFEISGRQSPQEILKMLAEFEAAAAAPDPAPRADPPP